MPEPIPTSPPAQTLKKWLVPAAILLAAAFLIVLVTVNWNAWTADRPAQVTDDAYLSGQ
jgi:multidrug resistance efflux pump